MKKKIIVPVVKKKSIVNKENNFEMSVAGLGTNIMSVDVQSEDQIIEYRFGIWFLSDKHKVEHYQFLKSIV